MKLKLILNSLANKKKASCRERWLLWNSESIDTQQIKIVYSAGKHGPTKALLLDGNATGDAHVWGKSGIFKK